MRAAWAIIFSLLVVLGQTMPASYASAPLKRCCGCECTDKGCCYGQASPRTPSAPMTAPVRQISSEQLQIVIRDVVAVINFAESPASQPIRNSSLFSGSTSVPLYYWNCSLLV